MVINSLPYNTNVEFTWDTLHSLLRDVKNLQYTSLTCKDYFQHKKLKNMPNKPVVFRIDVDHSPQKSLTMASIFAEEGITASFFYRLHAPEYNLNSFDNVRIVRKIHLMGFEIGLHAEPLDAAHAWQESPEDILRRDIQSLSHMLREDIVGSASHRDFSGINNLDFWKNHTPEEFGLWYEAYDEKSFGLFQEGRYVSDSEMIQWKAYDKGQLRQNDSRSLKEHLIENKLPLYILLHPFVFRAFHYFEE